MSTCFCHFLIRVSPNRGANAMRMRVRLALNTPDIQFQSDADRSPVNAVNNDAQGNKQTPASQRLSTQWRNELLILKCHIFITLQGQTVRIRESGDATMYCSLLKNQLWRSIPGSRGCHSGESNDSVIFQLCRELHHSCNLTHHTIKDSQIHYTPNVNLSSQKKYGYSAVQ